VAKSLSDILAVLGKKLSNQDIQHFFPHDDPADIRKLILEESKPSEAERSRSTKPSQSLPFSHQQSSNEFHLYTDGASRGNPGEAGAGAVVLNSQGQEVLTCSEYLGQCTNNIAEYKALILGLEKVQELSGQQVAIFMDSELIVRQIQGRYKVKNANLKPLFSRVQELLQDFSSYRVSHIPRAENKRADALANEGIDSRL